MDFKEEGRKDTRHYRATFPFFCDVKVELQVWKHIIMGTSWIKPIEFSLVYFYSWINNNKHLLLRGECLWYHFNILFSSTFFSSHLDFFSPVLSAGIYIHVNKTGVLGCNPGSGWLVVGLSAGEEEGKQPFRLIQRHVLRQGKRARRQKEGKRTQQMGGEIRRYQDQNGITTTAGFLENPFYPPCVHLFRIHRLNSDGCRCIRKAAKKTKLL